MYLCAMGIDFASSYDFQLDFETVPTVLYCLWFVHVFINCSDSVVLFVFCTRLHKLFRQRCIVCVLYTSS